MTDQTTDKFFDPKRIKNNLITASLFLSYYEILSNIIIEKICNFYNIERNKNGKQICSREYKEDIINRKFNNKTNIFRSSYLWLKDHKAITEDDCDKIRKIKEERDRIAHNLPKFLFENNFEIKTDLLDLIKGITLKIEKWWIVVVELDGIKVNIDDIQTGSETLFEYIFNIASFDLDELERNITRILKEKSI
ncbi:MAG TPA: hypothetical protein PKK00_13185 [Bacteroidales bacterium]|nr:hypothetical protein [Bacteroidales bacterium]